MKTFFTFLLAIVFSFSFAQTITFQKTYQVDSITQFNQVTPLSGGGYIACGTANNDHLVVKLDANGQVLWAKEIGDAVNQIIAYRIGEITGGGYYLLGLIDSTQSSGNGVLNLLKLDASGNTIWNKIYVVNNVDDLHYPSIRQLANGNFIISATYTDGSSLWEYYMTIKTDNSGNVLWSKSTTLTSLSKPHANDLEENQGQTAYAVVGDGYGDGLYVVSYDVAGNLLWAKLYSDLNNTPYAGHTVAKTSDGGYVVSSNANQITFKPALMKIDGNGNFLWAKSYVNPALNGQVVGNTSVSKTNDGGFILASLRKSSVNAPTYPYLIKTNSSGNILWAKYYTSAANNTGDFPYILVKQTSDRGFVVSTNGYGTGPDNLGWIIKTDSMGKTACNYSTVTLSDSIIVLNTSNASIAGPSVTSGVTNFATSNVTLNIPSSCYHVDSTSVDTTTTDTTVTTRIITKLMSGRKISVFPNPSHGEFSIRKGDMKLNSIEIYNAQGEKVKEICIIKTEQPEIKFDMSSQARGVYILKIAGEDGISYSRIILQ